MRGLNHSSGIHTPEQNQTEIVHGIYDIMPGFVFMSLYKSVDTVTRLQTAIVFHTKPLILLF